MNPLLGALAGFVGIPLALAAALAGLMALVLGLVSLARRTNLIDAERAASLGDLVVVAPLLLPLAVALLVMFVR